MTRATSCGCNHRSASTSFVAVLACMAAGCATNSPSYDIAQGAVMGAAGGAAVGAVVPGVSVIEGAAVGAAIGGLAGAVWADNNNDGYVDGYVQNGQYYPGTPSGYDPTLHRVAIGALGGSALGAAAGAVIPGVSTLGGAVIGSAVGGLAGAVWADRDNDGRADGFVYNGQYYAGAPAMAAPSYAFPARRGERDDGDERASGAERDDGEPASIAVPEALWTVSRQPSRSASLVSLRIMRRAVTTGESGGDLKSVGAWQTTNGALTRTALIALLERCIATLGNVGPECLAAVRAGAGDLATVPNDARREFAAIYKESCPVNVDEDTCVERLQNAAMFRALPRGGLHLSPLTMDEGKKTLFTAAIRDSGEIEGHAGLSTNIGFEPDAAHPGQEHRITVVPYSPKMCFSLRASDPEKVKIDPQPGEGRTIEPPTRVCMTQAEGMEATKYDPSWWVTPLSGNDLRLYLTIEHYVAGEKRNFPQEPWPIVVDVIPKPGLWARFDAFLEHATGTANLAANLAKAIGALITAITAWGIWGWLRRKRAAVAQ